MNNLIFSLLGLFTIQYSESAVADDHALSRMVKKVNPRQIQSDCYKCVSHFLDALRNGKK